MQHPFVYQYTFNGQLKKILLFFLTSLANGTLVTLFLGYSPWMPLLSLAKRILRSFHGDFTLGEMSWSFRCSITDVSIATVLVAIHCDENPATDD